MRIRMFALAASALLTAGVLAGCAQSTMGDMPGMDHGSGMLTPAPKPSSSFNSADEMFATMMIPHHQQAIQMADLLLGKAGISPEVTALARQIKAAQTPEIQQLQGWVTAWGTAMPTASSGMGDGMMSDADMSALETANGTSAERLFLQGMITHHQGAIDMANTEIASGQNPDAVALAKSIVAAQNAEITTMQQLLASR